MNKLKLLELLQNAEIEKAIDILKESIVADMHKEGKTGDIYKLIKKIMKENKKIYRDSLYGVQEVDGMHYYISNGYLVYRFENLKSMEGIPRIDFNLKKILEDAENNKDYLPLEMDIEHVKKSCISAMVSMKAIKILIPVKFITATGKTVGYNPGYIIDALKVIKDPRISIKDDTIERSRIRIIGNNGVTALILPVCLH